MKPIESLIELLPKYELFLIDLGGVIHDGRRVYPQARQIIMKLKSLNKKVLLLSNSPRPSKALLSRFYELNQAIDGTKLLTSGDFFISELQAGRVLDFDNDQVLLIGEQANTDLVNDMKVLNVKFTANIEKAKYFIMLAAARSQEELFEQNRFLDKAIDYSLIMLCANPDAIALDGMDRIFPSGSYAQQYQNFGGKVIFFGKPYKGIYDFALQDFDIPKSQILAIGDNIFTDVKGADEYQIDSLLITNGVHKNVPDIKHLCRTWNLSPNYIAPYLSM
jgi:HAD superfamily hydrolase (TIGR01459 family)